MDRRSQVEAGLTAVRARIALALQAAGREDEVTLVVVTKTHPASDVALLVALGVGDVAENKEQELRAKFPVDRDRVGLRVHYVGQLQSNKARSVAALADVVQSVDRAKIARALDRGRGDGDRPLEVTLQVSLDGAPGRGGAPLADVERLADEVAGLPGLLLRGVMAVAPLGGPPGPAFALLRETSERLRRSHPQARWISAGMSGDLESAVAEGATHLRVGSAILGTRPSLR